MPWLPPEAMARPWLPPRSHGTVWHIKVSNDINSYKTRLGIIYYVHQLQNIYFAITVEELTIK